MIIAWRATYAGLGPTSPVHDMPNTVEAMIALAIYTNGCLSAAIIVNETKQNKSPKILIPKAAFFTMFSLLDLLNTESVGLGLRRPLPPPPPVSPLVSGPPRSVLATIAIGSATTDQFTIAG
ncbi:unnamed protein product [Fraxinus pennsylvanica]|uniref:Uncharacterized protein n=1 Tax=Fraxinus pennsylvanica TaxID=56036 RepID=A0AAD2DG61_9LAMI|nr:unnamed protein product [Fraxinus pennsylvanica]